MIYLINTVTLNNDLTCRLISDTVIGHLIPPDQSLKKPTSPSLQAVRLVEKRNTAVEIMSQESGNGLCGSCISSKLY